MNKPQTINGLMRHLRDHCSIAIGGSSEKAQLISYGYYHGYKGYRFYHERSNLIPFTEFKEIIAVIDYDNELKSAFYPALMFLETALKSVVANGVLENLVDASFEHIYRNRMTDDQQNNKLRLSRLKLRDRIHSTLSRGYEKENRMVRNFYDKGCDVPLWAIFEIITLGEFGNFISNLDKAVRERLLVTLRMRDIVLDTNANNLHTAIFTIQNLRNSIAHNSPIFDARFVNRGPSRGLVKWLEKETSILNITFKSLPDYLILISTLLSKTDHASDRIRQLVSAYKIAVQKLQANVPNNIYTTIVYNNTMTKITLLERYIGM